ncbi:MAG: sigma 54-interacting transcriptional regulator [Planctomycetes bacterium]|nr:sigma 54-interacting transcriptional regulator [Planctomycetota bacterium]
MSTVKLLIESADGRGREFELSREAVIGRSPTADVVLADESCSRHHVRVVPEGGGCRFEDMDSTNGTFVNGTKQASGVLSDGDRLLVGNTVFRVLLAKRDPGATVVLEQALKDDAKIVDRRGIAELVAAGSSAADAPLLSALESVLETGRGTPDLHVLALALVDAAQRLLEPDRAAMLIYRHDGGDGRTPIVVSRTELRLDPDRAFVRECMAENKLLLLEQSGKSSQFALVAPLRRGTEPLALLYVDRRKKPFSAAQIALAARLVTAGGSLLHTADLHERLRSEVAKQQRPDETETRIVGESPPLKDVLRHLRRNASAPGPLLFVGETGTGKELFARHLHELSPRRNGPFVAINCSATPDSQLEAEILGRKRSHAKAITDDQLGAIERARGGSLFLDEIDALDLASQARLAAVLRERSQRAEGEPPLDVRLITASAHDLAAAVKTGGFHEELLALIATDTVMLPPLRDRRDDIPLLADHFLKLHSRRINRRARTLSHDALRALTSYQWPGNIRELSNVIERAVMLSSSEEVTAKLFPFPLDPGDLALDNVEKIAIERALAFCHYKKGAAAKALGISWPTLNKKIGDYGIEIPEKD